LGLNSKIFKGGTLSLIIRFPIDYPNNLPEIRPLSIEYNAILCFNFEKDWNPTLKVADLIWKISSQLTAITKMEKKELPKTE
jgi:ubiquitin-protein ligase